MNNLEANQEKKKQRPPQKLITVLCTHDINKYGESQVKEKILKYIYIYIKARVINNQIIKFIIH